MSGDLAAKCLKIPCGRSSAQIARSKASHTIQ